MYASQTSVHSNLLLDTNPIVYNDLRDCDLIIACQTHDQAAFTALYRRYRRFVFATLYRLSPDWSGSHEDMAQDVFMRVWGSLGTLKNPLAFKTWLHRLIANLFYDALRKRPSTVAISLDEPMNDEEGAACPARDIADTRNLPDEECARKELRHQINGAISLLPRQYAVAVALREIEGLEYEEIARLTKTELGTVKSRIARGRAKIQSRLKILIA